MQGHMPGVYLTHRANLLRSRRSCGGQFCSSQTRAGHYSPHTCVCRVCCLRPDKSGLGRPLQSSRLGRSGGPSPSGSLSSKQTSCVTRVWTRERGSRLPLRRSRDRGCESGERAFAAKASPEAVESVNFSGCAHANFLSTSSAGGGRAAIGRFYTKSRSLQCKRQCSTHVAFPASRDSSDANAGGPSDDKAAEARSTERRRLHTRAS
jgi:hypothetical protein